METFSRVLVLCYLAFLWKSAGSVVTSSQTEGTEIGLDYVKNISENEHCFYNGDDDVHRLPCRAGYTAGQSPGSSCKLCPFEEGGLKTFQPKQNLCEKCILCSECGEGKEVQFNCTRTTDTVCRPIVDNPVTKSTTPREDEIPTDDTTQTDKLPAMETKNRSSELTTDHQKSMAKKQPNWESRFWYMMAVAVFFFVTLVCCISDRMWKNRAWVQSKLREAVSRFTCCQSGAFNVTVADGAPVPDGEQRRNMGNSAPGADSAANTNGGPESGAGNGAPVAADSAANTNGGPESGAGNGAPVESNTERSVNVTHTPMTQEGIPLEVVVDSQIEVNTPASTGGCHMENGTQEEQEPFLP